MRSVANPVWRSVPPPDAPLEQRSDDELMRLAAAGLPAAYGALVRRHQRVVRSYCARVCGVAAAADDLAQEVFLQV
jgi:DNA-directed RNA polymerase specialized sigma24 family protein